MLGIESNFAVLAPTQAGASRMLSIQGSVTEVVKNLEPVTQKERIDQLSEAEAKAQCKTHLNPLEEMKMMKPNCSCY